MPRIEKMDANMASISIIIAAQEKPSATLAAEFMQALFIIALMVSLSFHGLYTEPFILLPYEMMNQKSMLIFICKIF